MSGTNGYAITGSDYVETIHFNNWYDLLRQHNGRIIGNPIVSDRIFVHFGFVDFEQYVNFMDEYQRLTTPIIETKPSLWKKIIMKIKW